ncbi:hypothetical protein JCM13580A_62840 [Streptomyces drozdowiczii]|uniref:RHS repeat domain-containing protein n=1 Tax=Streptomyces drozdowiczii TaxID=202862 RepID=UPI0031EE265C
MYGWDSRNNPTSAKMPTGATASMSGYQTIAGSDLPGTFKTPNGEESSYTYDTKGNTLSVATSGAEGGQQDVDYNSSSPKCGGFEGQTCSVEDAEKNKTSFSYDAQVNLSKVTPPAPMGATTYTYDALGRPLTVTNGNGVKQTQGVPSGPDRRAGRGKSTPPEKIETGWCIGSRADADTRNPPIRSATASAEGGMAGGLRP